MRSTIGGIALTDCAAEAAGYFYVIHGTIPELMPIVAYRRIGREQQYERKILKCPICGKRLTDMDAETHVELFKHPVRVAVHCQFYMKCAYCHSEVGINIA
jgi:uncharacterized protein with PIN domain